MYKWLKLAIPRGSSVNASLTKTQCFPALSHRAPSWSAGRTAASPTAFIATVPLSWRMSSFVRTVGRMPAVWRRSQCRGLICRLPCPGQNQGRHFQLCPLWPPYLQYQPHLLSRRSSEPRRQVSHRGAETRARAGNTGQRLLLSSSHILT